jgi:sulfur-carrier protein adenylyltransferase/sulfurtransferase
VAHVYSGVREPRGAAPLTAEELARYNRHLILPGVGVDGQQRLKRARVLVVGAGGLGSPIAMYLAAAGIGHLGIIDPDVVDRSNLQRQILHGTRDIGRRKTASAADRVADINPNVDITRFDEALTSANALEILADYDIVVDGTDNFPTRYLVNDACVILGKPNVYGSIIRFEGQASVFGHEGAPCYRCLFREPPAPGMVPNCAEGGVFGVVPGIVGSIQATEAIKLALGMSDTLHGRLLLIDVMRMRFRTIRIQRDPACPACGTREIRELIDYESFCGVAAPRVDTAPIAPDLGEITPRELAARLARGDDILLLDVREPSEWAIARIDGARLIPLATLQDTVSSIDASREIVIHCHHGIRSAAAVRFLRERGFERVSNLAGGIARWSAEVDATVPQY